jgi:hypothetical protein
MNWFLNNEGVVKGNPEEITTIIGNRTKGKGNRER